ncbi:MAG: extracellular solute-binding protein [Gammaproteobacteria bacterium]|nr:extracellular solute-binding protein [Gammaproteobacteria bacterium]
MPKNITRRKLLKRVAAGAIAAASPLTIRQSLGSSSGEVNVFAWGDYIQDNMKKAFENNTGIRINLSTYGSNEEAQNKLRAAGGKGFDLIFPSVDTRPDYDEGELLSEIDESRLKVDQIQSALWRSSLRLGAAKRGKRHLIPFNWGTEGITYDSSAHRIEPGEVSYGHLWGSGLEGKVAGRQKSMMVALALYLDSTGQVPSNRAMDLYRSEADTRRIFDECLRFLKPYKKNIGAFWNNATEATSAFTDSGCTIGQTWDTTGIRLHNDVDRKWVYTAPNEGALAWMDTMAIPSGAENVDQAYELINFLMTPEIGAMHANNTGYNSAAVGSDKHLSEANKMAFDIAYPKGAIENLWWWPMLTPWFSSVRQEYVEKMTVL